MSQRQSLCPLAGACWASYGQRAKCFARLVLLGARVFLPIVRPGENSVRAECEFSVSENNIRASIMSLQCYFTEGLLACGSCCCIFCRGCTRVKSLQASEYYSPSNNKNVASMSDVN